MKHTAKSQLERSMQLEWCIALEFYAISLIMHLCMHYYSFVHTSHFCNSIVLVVKCMYLYRHE